MWSFSLITFEDASDKVEKLLILECISIGCHKTKTNKPLTVTDKKKTNGLKSQRGFKVKTPNCLKRGKTRATPSWLVLVLHLIGWESGASCLDQSQIEVKQNQCNPGWLSTLSWKWLHESFWSHINLFNFYLKYHNLD